MSTHLQQAAVKQQNDYLTRTIVGWASCAGTEEDHAYWLEQQLGLIDKLGLENHRQSQMG